MGTIKSCMSWPHHRVKHTVICWTVLKNSKALLGELFTLVSSSPSYVVAVPLPRYVCMYSLKICKVANTFRLAVRNIVQNYAKRVIVAIKTQYAPAVHHQDIIRVFVSWDFTVPV